MRRSIRVCTPLTAAMLVAVLGQPAAAAEGEPAPASPAPAPSPDAPAPEGAPDDAAQPAPAPDPVVLPEGEPPVWKPGKETNCDNGKDDDGDSIPDCGDHDCHDAPNCKKGAGGTENSNARCSDWVDNDADGAVDCDDSDCNGPGVTICKGSWKGPLDIGGGAGMPSGRTTSPMEIPELGEGMVVEDLIGKGGDNDGERNDYLCSDGIDNDGDGKVDCADFGCRFDPDVNVCRGNPGMRFSVVANVGQEYTYDDSRHESFGEGQMDTRFTRVQLRSFGPMPLLNDSFYLLSLRAEKTPRLTFAMFQLPLGGGHFINVNSGGGNLSSALIVSTAKNMLVEPAYYVYAAFEQGNGAALEVTGPVDDRGIMQYRVFAGGGSGRFNGNVGGRYYTYDNNNYTYAGGAQFTFNIVGQFSRFDSQLLYTPVPTTFSVMAGAKWDQRAQERYAAWNVNAVLRSGRLIAQAETYQKKEFEFDSFQYAYVIQAGYLAIPKRLMFAADFGEYIAGDLENPPDTIETDLGKQRDERQWRVAAHLYLYKTIGRLTLLYANRTLQADRRDRDGYNIQRFLLEGQYRF